MTNKTLFFDRVFNYWFRANEIDFLRAAKDTSNSFSFFSAETVERFYKRMNAEPPKLAKEFGWKMDEDWLDNWQEYCGFIGIDFSDIKKTTDGLKYREVVYFQEPCFGTDFMDCIGIFTDDIDDEDNWKPKMDDPANIQTFQWISTEKELPKKSDMYMTYSKTKLIRAAVYYDGCLQPDKVPCFNGPGFYEYSEVTGTQFKVTEQITHWAKFPEPPNDI